MLSASDFRRGLLTRRDAAAMRARQRQHDRSGTVEFIHINKTGGSSIEQALGLPFHHQTAATRLDRLGAVEWNARYSFTFVRNPWDKLVSQYHFRSGRGRLRRDIDFSSWVRATLVDRDHDLMFRPGMFASQLDWISSPSGAVIVDDIYRYEALHDDFARLCARLGVTATLPHRKPSVHRHFTSYYDDQTAEIVGAVFQRDIETFGYRFEEGSEL